MQSLEQSAASDGEAHLVLPPLPSISKREFFFLCSCGDFSVPLKQCDTVMSCGDFFLTFDFRSLNFGPFSLIAPKREAEERLNSEQQELSSLQSELIDAEVRLCHMSGSISCIEIPLNFKVSQFFFIFHSNSSCLDVTSGPGRELQARP